MATTKKVAKKATKKSKKIAKPQSFRMTKEAESFLSFKLTEQTIYWLILLVLIFALSLWVLNIQINTNNILDSISALK